MVKQKKVVKKVEQKRTKFIFPKIFQAGLDKISEMYTLVDS